MRGAWPSDTAVDFFVIATFCLQDKPKLRPPMNQVKYDYMTLLKLSLHTLLMCIDLLSK